MAIPAGITTVTVTGRLLRATSGSILFTPSVQVLYSGPKVVSLPAPEIAQIDKQGNFSVVLPANDDAAGNPVAWNYRVTLRGVVGEPAPFNISVLSANGLTQDLATLAPVASSVGVPTVVGPMGPRGFEVVINDHADGTVTLTINQALALIDNLNGTATLNLAA